MSSNLEFVVSDKNEEPEILRARFQDLGYLFFKKYIAEEKCNSMLHSFLDEISPYLTYDKDAKCPVYNGTPFSETDPQWDEVYPKMQALEEFHHFFHEDDVLDLMRTVSGTEVFVYPIKMARISTPGKLGYETPPHQDAHSHHAGPTMAGIWVALHDVTLQMGRVKVLPGSHKQGVRRVFEAEGVGGVQCEIFPDETTWHVSDFEKGDVLIFHSCCIHKAEPNTGDRLARISVDTRFCDFGAPVFFTNLEPHHSWRIEELNWDYIYRNWQSEKLQRYWQDYPNLF
ncbi:MAG: phytanoyl-CoA dioxygenase family protein [Proteobacteria bacterium]|nr:phytanoyl-CoA dioxygenase family protein [Pseudomonadota bacterium]